MAPRFLVDLGPLQMRRFGRIMPYFSCQSMFERANLYGRMLAMTSTTHYDQA